MNRKKILEQVFTDPPPLNLAWTDIEDLFAELVQELGGTMSTGPGARTLIKLDGVRGVFPYPQRPNVGTIRYVRDFLITAGVRP